MKLNWVEKLFINSPLRATMQRQEARLLQRMGGAVENGKVLEIGCGRGAGIEIVFDLFRPSYLEAFDVDRDQVLLATRRLEGSYAGKLKLYQASATAIPSPANFFDAVFDFGVLHHVPDSFEALREIARVLRPEGRFFFMEPLSSFTLNPMMRLLTHHPPEAQFTCENLLSKLANAGLAMSADSYAVKRTRMVGVAWKRVPAVVPS